MIPCYGINMTCKRTNEIRVAREELEERLRKRRDVKHAVWSQVIRAVFLLKRWVGH